MPPASGAVMGEHRKNGAVAVFQPATAAGADGQHGQSATTRPRWHGACQALLWETLERVQRAEGHLVRVAPAVPAPVGHRPEVFQTDGVAARPEPQEARHALVALAGQDLARGPREP